MQARYQFVAHSISAERAYNRADRAKNRSERSGLSPRNPQSGAGKRTSNDPKSQRHGSRAARRLRQFVRGELDERENRENDDGDDAAHKSEM